MVLLSLIFILLFTSLWQLSFSLKCYECSGHVSCGKGDTSQLVNCAGKCMVYRNQYDGGNIIRRCCPSDCGTEDGLRTFEGRTPVYFCSQDACNGEIADENLVSGGSTTSPNGLTTTAGSGGKTNDLYSCYECTGHNPSCGTGDTVIVHNCQACMVYLNQHDGNTVIRRCCYSGCGTSDSISEYEGRQAYFCRSDRCNGRGTEERLNGGGNTLSSTSPVPAVSTTAVKSSMTCYECTGHNPSCGTGDTVIVHNCQACMVYLNQYDGNTVIRRCCYSGCGTSDSISEYEGRQAYFCQSDRCNGRGTEERLNGGSSTVTAMSTMRTPSTTTSKLSITCYDCSGTDNRACTSTMSQCPMCMIYPNDQNPKKFDRKCCWWGCGSPGQVSQFNGRPTYFCNTDRCNGPGQEEILLGTTTTTTTAVITTSTSRPASFRCYSCSGSECGREDSPLSSECPSCMVYYNQYTVERRCCWWACGPSNAVTDYNGNPTYFCSSDKCNGLGSENILPPPKMTTAMTTTSSTSTTTTYSSANCRLNCQNGSTPETEDGCFCYCVDNTSGRECENIDCSAGGDSDTDVCSTENQPLCADSDIFAYECLHLCGKC